MRATRLIGFLLLAATAASGESLIVEFRDPPLAVLRTVSVRAAMTTYQANFKRFRTDMAEANIRWEYREAFHGVSVSVPRSAIPAIQRLPYVRRVHLDPVVEAFQSAPPAHVTRIGADRVWSTFGNRGKGIVVAIIDTGIDYTHPALGGGIGPGFKVRGGYDFVNNDSDPMDDHYHGTHVAGIVAANSDACLGVAPEASLLAYKVLDATGRGHASTVLMGIERIVDPNGDGDLSDHADIANLSIGNPGGPDDALSRAVDHATAIGVVTVAGAGNEGVFYRVSSPATARTAIAVGATDGQDDVTPFSSKGPGARDMAIKPDVVAPGVSILSTLPGNQYGTLSGTSMASPAVAGVAALLKAIHPDWTPAQIKSAIVNSAKAAKEEVMARGAGRVDAFRAAGASVFVEPSAVSIGLDPIREATWSPAATIRLTNRGAEAVTYDIAAPAVAGVALTIPSSVTVPAGGTADVPLSFAVTNAGVTPGAASYSIGADVTLTRTTAAGDVLRVPWAAVKAARTTVTFEKPFPVGFWIDRAKHWTRMASIDEYALETLLAPGSYEMYVSWTDLDEVDVFYIENRKIEGDDRFPLLASQLVHTLTVDGRDENNLPLGSSGSTHAVSAALLLPALRLDIGAFDGRIWRFNDIAYPVRMQELDFDERSRSFYALQYPVLDGIHGDVTLRGGGPALKRTVVQMARPSTGSGGTVTLTAIDEDARTWNYFFQPKDDRFDMTVYMAAAAPGITATWAIGEARYTTPYLRLVNDRVIATSSWSKSIEEVGFLPAGTTFDYDRDVLLFGNTLKFPVTTISTTVELEPLVYVDWIGAAGEVRENDRRRTVMSLFGADGSLKSAGTKYSSFLDLTPRGPFTFQATSSHSTLTMSMDSSRADYVPPTFTSMNLLDAAARMAVAIAAHSPASLTFSAADYTDSEVNPTAYSVPRATRVYEPIRAEATKVWYRYAGTAEWIPLTPAQVTEHPAAGILFRVDLTPVANIDSANVDLRLAIEDASGNRTTYTMEPAFQVVKALPPGRRCCRR